MASKRALYKTGVAAKAMPGQQNSHMRWPHQMSIPDPSTSLITAVGYFTMKDTEKD